MKKYLEALLMVLSGSVAVYLGVTNKAPWQLVFTYWTALTVKNANDFFRGK